MDAKNARFRSETPKNEADKDNGEKIASQRKEGLVGLYSSSVQYGRYDRRPGHHRYGHEGPVPDVHQTRSYWTYSIINN